MNTDNPKADVSIGDNPTLAVPSGGSGASPLRPRPGGRFAAGDVILGRYTVLHELGEGGMGVVYQCLDSVGGVEVAVKGLPPEVSRNAEEMEDIRANYQIVRRLRHPNIAGVTSLEKDDSTGDYYLVMDLAQGVTLKSWMRRNPAAPRGTKMAILRQIAAALDYAHAEKVIHRDVKPENVMVDAEGRVKVLDFGLAAQIRSSQSRTSNVVTSKGGTPGYKSPEQWLGRPQRAAADVYSFGVLAYWMLAGHLPFDGDDPVVLGHAVISAPVEPVEGLPESMNAALAKALAKKPEERFPSCGTFVDALVGRVVPNAPQPGGSRSRATAMEMPDSRATAPLLIAAALVLAVLGGWWLFGGRARSPSAPQTGTTGVSPVASELRTGDTKTITLPGGAPMEMIYVAPGSFTMGSPNDEEGHDNNETLHRVKLTKGFWLGKYEVTQAQWQSVMGENPSSFKGDNRPVENVSWEDCQRFIRKINSVKNCGARLPTEAEWEYACRAGSSGPYAGNGHLNDMDWYYGNSRSKTHPVGQKQANAWGFHDMHGNVCEWCNDWVGDYGGDTTDPKGSASGEYRVMRGGGWDLSAQFCRSAHRSWYNPVYPFSGLSGLRLCCSAGPRE